MDTKTGVYVTDTRRGTGETVVIHGHRGGFIYVTFTSGPDTGTTVKVPASWVVA